MRGLGGGTRNVEENTYRRIGIELVCVREVWKSVPVFPAENQISVSKPKCFPTI